MFGDRVLAGASVAQTAEDPEVRNVLMELDAEPGDEHAIDQGMRMLRAMWGRHFQRRAKLMVCLGVAAIAVPEDEEEPVLRPA